VKVFVLTDDQTPVLTRQVPDHRIRGAAFVVDDTGGDAGSIGGGWSPAISTTTADYVSASGTVTIAAGSTSATVSVIVNGATSSLRSSSPWRTRS
jgi:hypothetical protein